MPVSFGQNCLHITFKPYLSSESYAYKYEKLPNIIVMVILSKHLFSGPNILYVKGFTIWNAFLM